MWYLQRLLTPPWSHSNLKPASSPTTAHHPTTPTDSPHHSTRPASSPCSTAYPINHGARTLHPDNDLDAATFRTLFARHIRWARLSVTLTDIAAENSELVRDLSKYDPILTVPLLAGLLTLPAYQSHCVRLEILVALAVVHCRGSKTPSLRHAQRWFDHLGHSHTVLAEDPAEDVFVSLVHDATTDYRLFEGAWEGAAFYTQRLLNAIARMPPSDYIPPLQRTLRALLVLSDLVCANARLTRYQLGSDTLPGAMSFRNLPGRATLVSRVTIPLADLSHHGVASADLAPLVLTPQMAAELPAQHFGCTNLDHHPVISHDDSAFILALPSALSIALRNHAISTLAQAGLLDRLDSMLAEEYTLLLSDTSLFGGPLNVPIHWQTVAQHRLSTACFEVDKGHYISTHFFLPSMHVHANGVFKVDYLVEDRLSDALQRSLNTAHSRLAAQPDFRRGLAVLIGCGWGKGYNFTPPHLTDDRWRSQHMSVADLVLLSHLDAMSPRYFWRLIRGFDVITKAGVHIQNINGILNLIAWVRHNQGHFVQHDQLPDAPISPQRPLQLVPPLNLLRDLRADVVQGYDGHCACDNTGRVHYVQRDSLNPFFDSDTRRQLYVSKDDARKALLTSLYAGRLDLWITVLTPNIHARGLTYRLWQMVSEWLHRIASVLDRLYHDVAASRTARVYVQFQDTDPPLEPTAKPTTETLERCCRVAPHGEPNAYRAIFDVGFLAGFRIPENVAERLVVRTLTAAFLTTLVDADAATRADGVVTEVVQNRHARQFHLFHSQTFTDHVVDALPGELITIDSIDEAAARVGLGSSALDTQEHSPIVGRGTCTQFMNQVVGNLLESIIEELGTFNRRRMLHRLVANCLKARAERDHWTRTSAAVLALHGDNARTRDRFVEQTSAFAGAATTSRVLIEIALCACPLDGGLVCADLDISKLMARAALVCRIGGLSDAIHYNALTPRIRVSSLGDILVTDDFGQFVVEPTLSHMMRDKLAREAPLQIKNYDAPAPREDLQDVLGSEFWNTWKAEMKFDLNEGDRIVGALEQRGIEEGVPILEIPKTEYFRVVASAGVSERAAKNFLDRFGLCTRSDWRTPPKGFTRRNLYPWRFGRDLSFVARPILVADDADDALLIIAPAALRDGFIHVVSGAHSGRLDRTFFRTREMKNGWLGRAREGHSFNRAVADWLAKASWEVRENVGLPEVLGRATGRDFGDIDVLAWRPGRRHVLVIECKDLAPARSYSEVAALLSDYQGAAIDGKRDKLRKHLDRVEAVRRDLRRVGRFTGVNRPEVVSCLVCSGVVPMQYAKTDALADTRVGAVDEIVASM